MLPIDEPGAADINFMQACKDFITRYVTPSTARTAALTKYLLQLSKQCAPRGSGSRSESARPKDED